MPLPMKGNESILREEIEYLACWLNSSEFDNHCNMVMIMLAHYATQHEIGREQIAAIIGRLNTTIMESFGNQA